MMPTAAEPVNAPAEPILESIGPLLLDGAWGRQARDYLGKARDVLFARHQAGASGGEIVDAWTAVVDHVVGALYEAARASYAERYTVLDQRVAIENFERSTIAFQSEERIVFFCSSTC